jgi:hypothetical protein
MDPSVRPLAAGAFYRARLPAATGRAGLEVGPHEHLAGGAPQWRGNVREDRTHPEEDKHRCERPPSCSEEYSHADPSLLLGRRTGDIEDRFRWVTSNDCAAAVRSGCNVGPARGSQRGTASPAPAAAQQLQVWNPLREKGTTAVGSGLYPLQGPVRFTGSVHPLPILIPSSGGESPGRASRCSGDRVSAPARPSAPA